MASNRVAYLSQVELTASIVICSQKGRPQLHNILQVDPFTRVLLPKANQISNYHWLETRCGRLTQRWCRRLVPPRRAHYLQSPLPAPSLFSTVSVSIMHVRCNRYLPTTKQSRLPINPIQKRAKSEHLSDAFSPMARYLPFDSSKPAVPVTLRLILVIFLDPCAVNYYQPITQ